jgi:DNA polymerase/3'-5' exonuclease PolX
MMVPYTFTMKGNPSAFSLFNAGPRPNKNMGQAFRKLAAEVMKSNEPNAGFQRSAFMKAAAAVEAHKEAIKSGKEASKLAGIGKTSAALIDEFLETGTMGERVKQEKTKDEKNREETGTKADKAKKEKAGHAFLDM